MCFMPLSLEETKTTKLTVYDDNITQSGIRCTEMTELLTHMVAAVSHEQDHASNLACATQGEGGWVGRDWSLLELTLLLNTYFLQCIPGNFLDTLATSELH